MHSWLICDPGQYLHYRYDKFSVLFRGLTCPDGFFDALHGRIIYLKKKKEKRWFILGIGNTHFMCNCGSETFLVFVFFLAQKINISDKARFSQCSKKIMWGCFKSTSPKNPSLWLARLGESGAEWDWTTWRAKCLERSLKLQSPDRSEHYSDVLPHLSSYFLLRCKTKGGNGTVLNQHGMRNSQKSSSRVTSSRIALRPPFCHPNTHPAASSS